MDNQLTAGILRGTLMLSSKAYWLYSKFAKCYAIQNIYSLIKKFTVFINSCLFKLQRRQFEVQNTGKIMSPSYIVRLAVCLAALLTWKWTRSSAIRRESAHLTWQTAYVGLVATSVESIYKTPSSTRSKGSVYSKGSKGPRNLASRN